MEKLYNKYNVISSDNVKYTVDMLRLRTNFTYEDFSKIEFYIQSVLMKKYNVCHYCSTDISSFKYNYVIKLAEKKSFWFGFIHNSELFDKNVTNEKNSYNFTVEFNPNKVDFSFLDFIFCRTRKWIVNSVDFAFDIPINIKDLFLFDKNKKRQMTIFSKGFEDKTIYMGKSNNRVKIYNKKIESNLDKDLTRVEISSQLKLNVENIDSYFYDVKLPTLYLNEYLYSFDDLEYKKKNPTLYAILYALQYGYDFNDISRKYKDKIKGLLRGGYDITFSNEVCTNVLKKLIKTIFEYV